MTALSPTHQAAHDYARRGWRVVPVKPGEKVPAVNLWPTVATLDADKIDDWWGRWPNFGVGIVTGRLADGRYLFVVDVDIANNKGGDDTLTELERLNGPLPHTIEAVTGTGGRHLLFMTDVEIRNEQARRLGPGIDIRGEGGFIVAAPTIHPNGNTYEWELEHHPDGTVVADAPAWLITLLTSEPEGAPRADRILPPAHTGTPRIGDRIAAMITWPELLTRDGARFERHARDPWGHTYEHWSRPGVADGHTAATLYYHGTDRLKVFSSNWPGLTELETYDRYRYIVATRYNNDYRRATRELAKELNDDMLRTIALSLEPGRAPNAAPTPSNVTSAPTIDTTITSPPASPGEPTTWEPDDTFADPAADDTPITPDWLTRTDGVRLFYKSKINGLIGESGSGKSWVALVACAETLATGGTVLYIDLEDHPRNIRARLRALGATAHLHRLKYIRPELAAGTAAVELIDRVICEYDADMLVIDSVGEAMALQGLKQNDDDDVARWYRHYAHRWGELGPAVILIDHMPKNTENSKLSPIGSQRKKAATDGALYRVDQIKPLARGEHGILTLTTAKDRLGAHPNDQVAAQCHFRSADAGATMVVEIAPPEARTETGTVMRPTVLMERLSKALEHGPAMTYNNLMRAVTGNTAGKRRAIEMLITDGFVGTHEGGNRAVYHHSIKPFRNDQIPENFGPDMTSNVTGATSDTTVKPRCDQVAPADGESGATTRDHAPYVVGAGGGRTDRAPTPESPTPPMVAPTDADDDPLF